MTDKEIEDCGWMKMQRFGKGFIYYKYFNGLTWFSLVFSGEDVTVHLNTVIGTAKELFKGRCTSPSQLQAIDLACTLMS